MCINISFEVETIVRLYGDECKPGILIGKRFQIIAKYLTLNGSLSRVELDLINYHSTDRNSSLIIL